MLILDHHFFHPNYWNETWLCVFSVRFVFWKNCCSTCTGDWSLPSGLLQCDLWCCLNESLLSTQPWALLLLLLGSQVSLISIIDKTLASSSSRSEEKSLGTTTVLTRSVGHLLTMQANVASVKCLSSLISPKALCMLSWKSFHWRQSLSSICVSPKEQESQLRKVG